MLNIKIKVQSSWSLLLSVNSKGVWPQRAMFERWSKWKTIEISFEFASSECLFYFKRDIFCQKFFFFEISYWVLVEIFCVMVHLLHIIFANFRIFSIFNLVSIPNSFFSFLQFGAFFKLNNYWKSRKFYLSSIHRLGDRNQLMEPVEEQPSVMDHRISLHTSYFFIAVRCSCNKSFAAYILTLKNLWVLCFNLHIFDIDPWPHMLSF